MNVKVFLPSNSSYKLSAAWPNSSQCLCTRFDDSHAHLTTWKEVLKMIWNVWIKNDDMVMAWVTNSMSSNIQESFNGSSCVSDKVNHVLTWNKEMRISTPITLKSRKHLMSWKTFFQLLDAGVKQFGVYALKCRVRFRSWGLMNLRIKVLRV